MTFTLTPAQIATLAKAPTDNDGLWHLDIAGDRRIEVEFDYWSPLRTWERFITVEGDIERWDADISDWVPATFEPEIGSYPISTRTGELTHRSFYY